MFAPCVTVVPISIQGSSTPDAPDGVGWAAASSLWVIMQTTMSSIAVPPGYDNDGAPVDEKLEPTCTQVGNAIYRLTIIARVTLNAGPAAGGGAGRGLVCHGPVVLKIVGSCPCSAGRVRARRHYDAVDARHPLRPFNGELGERLRVVHRGCVGCPELSTADRATSAVSAVAVTRLLVVHTSSKSSLNAEVASTGELVSTPVKEKAAMPGPKTGVAENAGVRFVRRGQPGRGLRGRDGDVLVAGDRAAVLGVLRPRQPAGGERVVQRLGAEPPDEHDGRSRRTRTPPMSSA